ncbi:hypothetical protein GOODEAATRI_028283, partial [Goodea atripinnis]
TRNRATPRAAAALTDRSLLSGCLPRSAGLQRCFLESDRSAALRSYSSSRRKNREAWAEVCLPLGGAAPGRAHRLSGKPSAGCGWVVIWNGSSRVTADGAPLYLSCLCPLTALQTELRAVPWLRLTDIRMEKHSVVTESHTPALRQPIRRLEPTSQERGDLQGPWMSWDLIFLMLKWGKAACVGMLSDLL